MRVFCFLLLCLASFAACVRQGTRRPVEEKIDSQPPVRVLAEVKKFGVPRISLARDAILVDLELASPEGFWSREVEIKTMETGFLVRVWLNPLREEGEEGVVLPCWVEEVRIPVSRAGGFDIEVEGKNGKQMDIVFVD
ncbi:MAG: hypothetical protein CVV50_02935 [Spirochaetae bacterium HGW-Spirochaetae-6]|nr:MAG: hypothetical protein CVV50_02935 [Spirochaetae bacterium HGW-Spirochaetae-6]